VSRVPQKITPVRLNPELYEQLRQEVLRRDGWRCQACGTISNLEVHHKQSRSHSGEDSAENLIALCATCHAEIHKVTTASPGSAMRGKLPNDQEIEQALFIF
jgi:5-methylcytosine-specific restriction endonuclease McrA